MSKITNVKELNAAILQLEIKQRQEEELLNEQIEITIEGLKPTNLIKNTVNELMAIPDFKSNILKMTLSMVAGYFTKKLAIGSTSHPLKVIIGTAIQFGVTNILSKNSENIRGKVVEIFRRFFKKKENNKEDQYITIEPSEDYQNQIPQEHLNT